MLWHGVHSRDRIISKRAWLGTSPKPWQFHLRPHQAFFAGFLPTPQGQGPHPRHFALRFPGSESTARTTCLLDAPTIPQGLAQLGYKTVCIGGVGFFNPGSPLGRVLPGYFQQSCWPPELGVVLFQVLTGAMPFPAQTAVELYMRIKSSQAPRLKSLRPDARWL
jgi:hypothetical protein